MHLFSHYAKCTPTSMSIGEISSVTMPVFASITGVRFSNYLKRVSGTRRNVLKRYWDWTVFELLKSLLMFLFLYAFYSLKYLLSKKPFIDYSEDLSKNGRVPYTLEPSLGYHDKRFKFHTSHIIVQSMIWEYKKIDVSSISHGNIEHLIVIDRQTTTIDWCDDGKPMNSFFFNGIYLCNFWKM